VSYVLSRTDDLDQRDRRLKIAIAEAIAAFEQSGRMGDAALVYARHGFPICPLTINKLPIPKRDPDPTGQYPEGIPGTGGVYKATTDPIIITAWWRRHPKALIGLPTGSRTGIWAIDADTAIDHTQESVTAWQALLLQHETLVTRQHLSSTGGLHVIFNWYPDQPIGFLVRICISSTNNWSRVNA